jgi:hypothetical protein
MKASSVNSERLVAIVRQPWMVVLIWLGALLKLGRVFASAPPVAKQVDFVNYYDSALALRHGIDPYITNLTSVGDKLGLETVGMIYASETPTFLLCFEPLTHFSPATAYGIWTALNAACLLIAIYLLLVHRPGLASDTAWLLGGLSLAFHPVGYCFVWAQSGVLVLTLMVLALRELEAGRNATAGLIIAAAGLLRAYPFLIVGYLVLRRNWRAAEFAIGGMIVGGLVTMAILGFWQCMSFLHGAAYVANRNRMIDTTVISVGPFAWRLVSFFVGTAAGGPAGWIRSGAMLLANAVFLGMTIRATLIGRNDRDDYWRIYSLWIVTSIMVSPIAWHHYLVPLIIPFVQVAVAAGTGRASHRAVWMAAASYLMAAISLANVFPAYTLRPTAFRVRFPSLAASLAEVGFLTLLMAYVATYWFVTDRPYNNLNGAE